MLIINLLILKQMRMFRFLLPFLLGLVLIGCNNDDPLLTSKKQGLKSQSDFDPKNKVGYVLNAEEIEEVALAIPLEFSSSVATKAGLVSKKVKETIPFNQTKWGRKSEYMTKAVSEENILTDNIYIVNYKNNEGFTILSTNNQVERVLAYSDQGNLTEDAELPGGVEMFMENLSAYVASTTSEIHPYPTDSVDTDGYYYCNPVYYYGDAEYEIVRSKINAQWGNTFPYNNECPIIMDDTRYGVGCVAIALGQIMSYFQYPTTIYSERYATTLSLNWSSFPAQFSELNDNSKAIAALLKKIANCVNMQYDIYGVGLLGGSTITDAYSGLSSMGYTSDAVWPYTSERIKSSLDSSRPVFISGTSSSGSGHAWIVDGYRREINRYYCDWDVYDSNNNYVGVWTTLVDSSLDHVESLLWYYNWGWDGSYNGYYTAGVYQTDAGNYDQNVKILTNIRRN